MRRSIIRRCWYTGESYQQALVAIALLDAGQRLIPDATDSDQQRLEAVLLHRMLQGRATHPSAAASRTTFGVRTVQPSTTGLTLSVPAGAEPKFASSLTVGQAFPAAPQGADVIEFQRRSGCRMAITAYGLAAEVNLACSWSGLRKALALSCVQDAASVLTLDATARAAPAAAHHSALSALLRRLMLFTRDDHLRWLLGWYANVSQGRSAPPSPPAADLLVLLADPHFGVPKSVLDVLHRAGPPRSTRSAVDTGGAGVVTVTRSTRSHNVVDDMPIGRRIAYWRDRRRMSQQVFADRLGKSRSWVDKVERGIRRLDKFSVIYDIADVLQIDVPLLLGKEVEQRPEIENYIDQVEVEEIRAALERYDHMSAFFEAPAHSPSLSKVRRAVAHAWLTYQHGKYGTLARMLPKLLRDAQAADRAYADGSEASAAAHLLGQVYQVASSALRKVGEHELSWLAADRSIAVSQRAGDHLLAGLASYRVGSALLALGRIRPSLEINVNVAGRRAPDTQDHLPEQLSVYGMLLLNGAMAASRIGDSATVRELITAADEAVQELGGGRNHFWTGFDSAKVQLRVAGECHERLHPDSVAAMLPQHRANHYLNIARRYTQIGDTEKAGEMLTEGDRHAPPEIRCRPLAHEILSDVLRRTRGTPPAPIAELAEQMGIGV